jgi:hypothetical protein
VTEATPAIERFRALLERARPPTGGVPLTTLEAEVAPVLPLLEELPLDNRSRNDFTSFGFREVFTVLTLLGRRLALLDLTPTAAVSIVELVLRSVRGATDPPTDAFDQQARTAVVEGFVRGREEHVETQVQARAARAVRPLRIDDETFALVLSGVHAADAISEYVDALGRAMLDADVSIGIVDVTQLSDPNRERARAVFAAEEVTRLLGGSCVFSGVDPRWRAAAADAHIDLELLRVVPTFAKALTLARATADGVRSSANPRWRMLLERLRR